MTNGFVPNAQRSEDLLIESEESIFVSQCFNVFRMEVLAHFILPTNSVLFLVL